MEELSVSPSANLIDWRWVQIDENASRNIFPIAGLRKEGFHGTDITSADGIWINLAIWRKAMFKKIAN